MSDNNNLLECPQCGWVHVGVSEVFVKGWEEDWKRFWPTLNQEGREAFNLSDGPPTREGYLKCFNCGNRELSSFFPTNKNLDGYTIQPILIED